MRAILIGDSIRMNAQPFVRDRLPAEVSLIAPAENCGSSEVVRARLREWLPAESCDVVHINCGLHDIRYDPGRLRPVSLPHEYAENLRAIFAVLVRTCARVVWATSTPIDEVRHNIAKASRRYRIDLLEYNRISIEIADAFGIRIHDLHARLMQAPIDALLLPDGVHYTGAGNELIGGCIAEAILSATD